MLTVQLILVLGNKHCNPTVKHAIPKTNKQAKCPQSVPDIPTTATCPSGATSGATDPLQTAFMILITAAIHPTILPRRLFTATIPLRTVNLIGQGLLA